jgi:hypothetical protein
VGIITATPIPINPKTFLRLKIWKSSADVILSSPDPIVTWMTETGPIPMKHAHQKRIGEMSRCGATTLVTQCGGKGEILLGDGGIYERSDLGWNIRR